MQQPIFRTFDEIHPKEILTGFWAQAIHTPGNTINFISVKAGSSFPLHQHIHHQCAFVLEGEFEMTINGETQTLKPGLFVVIPSNITHSGRAITDCKLLDIFNPVREDYK
ncbi:MAG: cupin domain-containing protein [Bacteroidota bacterium]